jgi:hypothetical protein
VTNKVGVRHTLKERILKPLRSWRRADVPWRGHGRPWLHRIDIREGRVRWFIANILVRSYPFDQIERIYAWNRQTIIPDVMLTLRFRDGLELSIPEGGPFIHEFADQLGGSLPSWRQDWFNQIAFQPDFDGHLQVYPYLPDETPGGVDHA